MEGGNEAEDTNSDDESAWLIAWIASLLIIAGICGAFAWVCKNTRGVGKDA